MTSYIIDSRTDVFQTVLCLLFVKIDRSQMAAQGCLNPTLTKLPDSKFREHFYRRTCALVFVIKTRFNRLKLLRMKVNHFHGQVLSVVNRGLGNHSNTDPRQPANQSRQPRYSDYDIFIWH